MTGDSSCFAGRLNHYLPLTNGEKAALSRLEEEERTYKKGSIVQREHDRANEIYIVKHGWLASFVVMDDGSRQIVKLHFPGDMAGVSGVAFEAAGESLIAITDVTLCPFDKYALGKIFADYARLAALLFSVAQLERISISDRLASIGKTPAKARVAALLLDSLARLRIMNPDMAGVLTFPLTQEEIGDATGLTAVHVNRMMRSLTEDGMVQRSGNQIRLLDEEKLAKAANYSDRYSALDASWLPPAPQD